MNLTSHSKSRDFITTQDWSQADLQSMLDTAKSLKQNPFRDDLKGKSVALLFLNSSMRTRTSFQVGVHQLGGFAVVLQPGSDAWPIEFEFGTVMDGEPEEHISEASLHELGDRWRSMKDLSPQKPVKKPSRRN